MTPDPDAGPDPRSGRAPGRGFLPVLAVILSACGPGPMSGAEAGDLLALAIDHATEPFTDSGEGGVWFDAEGAVGEMGDAVAADAAQAILERVRFALPEALAGAFDEQVACRSSLDCDPTPDSFYSLRDFHVEPDGRVRVTIGLTQVVGQRASGYGVSVWVDRDPAAARGGWRFLSLGPYVVS